MRINDDLTGLFDTPAKMQVLRYVLKPGFMMTGRELARVCGLSQTIVIKILKEFEGYHLVSNRRAGASVMWSPRPESYTYSALSRIFAEQAQFSPAEHLKGLIKKWAGSNKYAEKAVIFGSVADKTDKPSSDIDLFVLVKTERDREKAEKSLSELSLECISLYGNTLNPYILTEKELKTKKNSALFRNIEKGVRIV